MSTNIELHAEVKPHDEWQYFGEYPLKSDYKTLNELHEIAINGTPADASLILQHLYAFTGVYSLGTWWLPPEQIAELCTEERWVKVFGSPMFLAKWPIRFIFWLN